MWFINIHLSWVNRDTKISNSMECELESVRDSEPCQTMTWLSMLIMFRMPCCTQATVVIGLSAVPSDHVKSKLYIKGVRLFMGGVLTAYWRLITWEKLYQGKVGHFLPWLEIAVAYKWLMETYYWKLKRAVFLKKKKKIESKQPEKYEDVSASSLTAAIYVVPLFCSECSLSLVL